MSLWRNRLARSAVNRKVGGSSPPRDDYIFEFKKNKINKQFIKIFNILTNMLVQESNQVLKLT